MAFSDKHQCIHCEVTSCQHHDAGDLCQLDAINVKPRCDCHSGKCDESECGSYRAKYGTEPNRAKQTNRLKQAMKKRRRALPFPGKTRRRFRSVKKVEVQEANLGFSTG